MYEPADFLFCSHAAQSHSHTRIHLFSFKVMMAGKSPSLRRIKADIRELCIDPSDRYVAAPIEDDMFEW